MLRYLRYENYQAALLLCVLSAAGIAGATDADAPHLILWVKADDLRLKDGERVDLWPDASGYKHDLISAGDGRPTFAAKSAALGGRPAVVFGGGSAAQQPSRTYMSYAIGGEHKGVTLFFVGDLSRGRFFETAPGQFGNLRAGSVVNMDWFTQGNIGMGEMGNPGLSVSAIAAGYDANGAMKISVYCNGKLQDEKTDPNCYCGVRFINPLIGIGGNEPLAGELSAFLVYDKLLNPQERESVERYLKAAYSPSPSEPKGTDKRLLGFAPPPPPATQPPLAAIKSKPVDTGLQVWVRADALTPLTGAQTSLQESIKPGAAAMHKQAAPGVDLVQWPNEAGDRRPLLCGTALKARILPDGIGRRPTVAFNDEKENHCNFTIPLPESHWTELTVFAAGKEFRDCPLMESAPGNPTSVRINHRYLALEQRGDINDPWPLPVWEKSQPALVAFVVRRTADGAELRAYQNGGLTRQKKIQTASPEIGIRNPVLGAVNKDMVHGPWQLSEFLCYNRALSESELHANFAYLSEKYSVPLLDDLQTKAAVEARSPWTTTLPAVPHSVTWLGNSFSGVTDWVQSGIWNTCAFPDGTVVATGLWDERHKELGEYKDGKCVPAEVAPGSGRAVVTDGTYIYRALEYGGPKVVQIRRYEKNQKYAPWSKEKQDINWKFEDVDGQGAPVGVIASLAVGRGLIYASLYGENEIRVFDSATAEAKGRIKVDAPKGKLALDANGNLWVGWATGLKQYTPDGKETGKQITGVSVGALCVDGKGHLLVGDNDKLNCVLIYDVSGVPNEIGTVGSKGGIMNGPRPGVIAPDRLFGINAVSVDGSGHIYVSANNYIRAFDPDGKNLWCVYCNEFCTTGGFDPATDGNDVYTADHHYHFNPGNTNGPEWEWVGEKLGSNMGSGVPRRLDGRLYYFTISDSLNFHRQEANSERFVACGMQREGETKGDPLFPEDKGRTLWSDRNDNGKVDAGEITWPATPEGLHREFNWGGWVDEKGDIWHPAGRRGLRRLPLQGFTANGAPLYDFATEQAIKRPPEMLTVERVFYFPEDDTMYLVGTTWEDQNLYGLDMPAAGRCGRQIVRYDNWSKPTRKVHCRMGTPAEVAILSADVAHKTRMAFMGDVGTASIFAFDTDSGKLLGVLEPDTDKVGPPGWIDIWMGVRAFSCKNGETLVLEENSYSENEIVYRIPPLKK